jgi:hypothetical protein
MKLAVSPLLNAKSLPGHLPSPGRACTKICCATASHVDGNTNIFAISQECSSTFCISEYDETVLDFNTSDQSWSLFTTLSVLYISGPLVVSHEFHTVSTSNDTMASQTRLLDHKHVTEWYPTCRADVPILSRTHQHVLPSIAITDLYGALPYPSAPHPVS